MPNHITNIIEVVRYYRHDDIRSALLNDENRVDFNKIIPMPEELKITSDGWIGLLDNQFSWHRTLKEELDRHKGYDGFSFDECMSKAIDNFAQGIKNYLKHGHASWHSWACENWGTKWNAYDQPENGFSEGETCFKFQTAWSHPSEIIDALSQKFPEAELSIQYADEDTGSNCGTYKIKDGVRRDENISPPWKDMSPVQKREFTSLAWGISHANDDPKEYGYEENWNYVEDQHD